MCLTGESHSYFCKLAIEMEDEKLLSLDKYYRNRIGTSVDWQLHGIVMREIHRRRQEKREKLEIALWHSSKRGKAFRMLKRKLIRWGLYSSANQDGLNDDSIPIKVILRLLKFPRQKDVLIWTLPGRQTPLSSL